MKDININSLKNKYTNNQHSYLEIENNVTSWEIKLAKKGLNLVNKVHELHPFIRYPLGLVFIGIGVIGIFMPILPGFIFIIPGVGIFSKKSQVYIENKLEDYITWREKQLTKKKNLTKN